uniref:Cytochrome P450 n=1 Tax=Oryza barthii TaxID=65489 RepID=A0A0D3FKA8_9ORYZ
MDELSAGSLYLVVLGTLALALAFKRVLRGKETGVKLPPGPWNLPIIGSLHHLVGAYLPHRALLRVSRRQGPLMLPRLGEVPAVVVSSPEAAMEFLRTRDPPAAGHATLDIVSFGGKGIVMAPYGEHWRQVRNVCVVELLSTRQAGGEEVSRLVEAIATTSPATASIGMTQTLAALNNDIIARAVPTAGGLRYLRVLKVVATLAGSFNMVDLFPSSRLVRWLSCVERRLREHHAQTVRIVDSIIQDRKENEASASPGASAEDDDNDDLLDVLLRLQREDNLTFPITAEIIGALISDIFGAATDTTGSTLEWAMAELMRNPRAMEKAKQEVQNALGQGRAMVTGADIGDLHYLQMVIKETLRTATSFYPSNCTGK